MERGLSLARGARPCPSLCQTSPAKALWGVSTRFVQSWDPRGAEKRPKTASRGSLSSGWRHRVEILWDTARGWEQPELCLPPVWEQLNSTRSAKFAVMPESRWVANGTRLSCGENPLNPAFFPGLGTEEPPRVSQRSEPCPRGGTGWGWTCSGFAGTPWSSGLNNSPGAGGSCRRFPKEWTRETAWLERKNWKSGY